MNRVLVTVCDCKHYEKLLALIVSLKNHSKEPTELCVLITDMEDSKLFNCAEICEDTQISIDFVNIQNEMISADFTKYDTSEYGGLFSLIIDFGYEEYLFLSVNSIVSSDISELFSVPLSNDIGVVRKCPPDEAFIKKAESFGMDPLDYASTRVMIVKNHSGITAEFNDMATRSIYDEGSCEDLINRFYNSKFCYLDGCWNTQIDYFMDYNSIINHPKEYGSITRNARIITYPDGYRYWENVDHPFAPLFWKEMRGEPPCEKLLNFTSAVQQKKKDSLRAILYRLVNYYREGGISEVWYIVKSALFSKLGD